MVYGQCEYCGKTTQANYKSTLKRFCSHACSNKYKWENIRPRTEYVTKNCEYCGKEFAINKRDHRVLNGQEHFFCSHKCSTDFKLQESVRPKCLICGEEIKRPSRSKTTCPNCRNIYKQYLAYKRLYNESATVAEFLERKKHGDAFVYSGNESEYLKKYCNDNRERINRARYERDHSSEVIMYSLLIKKRIISIYSQKTKKPKTNIESILGCSAMEFVKYIDGLLGDGMTPENYGEWELDHIVPLSSAKSKDDVERLCHYTNYQPLWAADNKRKTNKQIPPLGHS